MKVPKRPPSFKLLESQIGPAFRNSGNAGITLETVGSEGLAIFIVLIRPPCIKKGIALKRIWFLLSATSSLGAGKINGHNGLIRPCLKS